MELLKGAEVSGRLKAEVLELHKRLEGKIPKLAIIRVGENPDDISYERGAVKKVHAFGMEAEVFCYPGDISHEEFKKEFQNVNDRLDIDGILMLRPLPEQICEADIETMIDPQKDLDGISPVNIAKVFKGDNTGFAPCTAEAVIETLKANHIPIEGRRVVIVGRSLVVGKPLAMLMIKENATVTVCHTRTLNLEETCKNAQILVAAAGRPRMFCERHVGEGAVVMDVGIHVEDNGNLCGDVDLQSIEGLAAKATPVPGGIGAVTTAVLAKHLAQAALNRL